MRTTVNLDLDVVAALQRICREQGIGLSEALNALARRGLTAFPERHIYSPEAADIGLAIDVSNIGEVLDRLEHGRR